MHRKPVVVVVVVVVVVLYIMFLNKPVSGTMLPPRRTLLLCCPSLNSVHVFSCWLALSFVERSHCVEITNTQREKTLETRLKYPHSPPPGQVFLDAAMSKYRKSKYC